MACGSFYFFVRFALEKLYERASWKQPHERMLSQRRRRKLWLQERMSSQKKLFDVKNFTNIASFMTLNKRKIPMKWEQLAKKKHPWVFYLRSTCAEFQLRRPIIPLFTLAHKVRGQTNTHTFRGSSSTEVGNKCACAVEMQVHMSHILNSPHLLSWLQEGSDLNSQKI